MAYRSYRGANLNLIFAIIGINILIFLPTIVSQEIRQDLLINFGLWSKETFLDYPWGIVTSMFIHDGFFHLFANMITLYFFGTYLYRLLGSRRFLLVYFGGGILGSLFFVLLAPPFSLAVGASGAVFALGGAMAVMVPRLRVFIFPIPAPLPLWIAVIGIFSILTLLAVLDLMPIAWEAHLGGLLFGLGAGYLLKKRRRYYY